MNELSRKKKGYNISLIAFICTLLSSAVQARCTISLSTYTVLSPSSYRIQYQPSNALRSSNQQTALKVMFPVSSGIEIQSQMTCIPVDYSSFNVAQGFFPSCTRGQEADQSPYFIIEQLKPGQFQYDFEAQLGIFNANAAKRVNGITCSPCVNALDCTSLVSIAGSGDSLSVSYQAKTVLNTVSTVLSGLKINGDKASTLTIGMILSDPVMAFGSVRILMPKTNQQFLELGSAVSYSLITGIDSGATQFTVKAQYGLLGATARTAIPLAGTPTIETDVTSSNQDELKVLLGNTLSIGRNSILELIISPITNPPSQNPITGFEFYTGDKEFNVINQQLEGITLETSAPGTFLNSGEFISKVEILDGKTMVDTTGVTYRWTVFFSNDIPRKSKLYITFPPTWDLTTKPQVSCSFGCAFINDATTHEPSTNTLQLLQGFEGLNAYQYAPGPIIFDLIGMKNPATTAKQYFTVTTYNQDGNIYKIDESGSIFNLAFTTGKITIINIYPSLTEIMLTTGTYNVLFQCEHDILPTYKLVMKMAPGLIVQQKSGCAIIGSVIASTYQCNADASNNEIVVQKMTETKILAGTLIQFSVDAITNPSNFADPGQAYFKLSLDDGLIDEGYFTIASGIFTPSTINSLSVYAHDQTSSKYPVKYSFTLTPKARVAKGSYILLTLPTEVRPYDVASMQRGCLNSPLSGFSNKQISCSYLDTTNQVKIMNGMQFKDTDGNPPVFKWDLTNLKNPRGLITSSFFNVSIYQDDGKPLYQFVEKYGANVTMSLLPEPASLELQRTSYTNGVPVNLTFNIRATNYLSSYDKIIVRLPRPVGFTDATKCIGQSYYLEGILNCNKSGDLQEVYVSVSVTGRYATSDFRRLNAIRGRQLYSENIPSGELMTLTLTNVTSPGNFRPSTDTVEFTLRTQNDSKLEYLKTNIKFQNSIPGQISPLTASVAPNYWEKGKEANYTVKFIPLNFEQNMKIVVSLDNRVTIPQSWNKTCIGIKGTDKRELTCEVDWYEYTITLTDAEATKDIIPDVIEFVFVGLVNPIYNIVTNSFKIRTHTWDGYEIDYIDSGLELNFYCTFPCATCNLNKPDQCYSCYGPSATYWNYLWDQQCLDNCPDGMYEETKNITVGGDPIMTCSYCDNVTSHCQTCGLSKSDCLTCTEGYLLYDVDHTCYEAVNWYFPYLILMFFFVVLSWIADCCYRETNILHSMMFFLSFLEVGLMVTLIALIGKGLSGGDRSLTMVSFASHILLNTLFIVLHIKVIMPKASLEYKQVEKEFKYIYWSVNGLAYSFNFKISLFLISSFFGRAYFGGTFNSSSWAIFNIFSLLYIFMVYIPLLGDFYSYFMEFGLRKLTSFVMGELVIIQTVIALLLLLEILNQWNCAGMQEVDLGKRANLFAKEGKKSKKGKRKALRSGMGNDESYGSEDSDEFSDAVEVADDEDIPEGPEGEDLRKAKASKFDQLAAQMKREREEIQRERERLLKQEAELLRQKGSWKEETDRLRKELVEVKKERNAIVEGVDSRIEEKLGNWDGNPHKTPLGQWIVSLPKPVTKTPVVINVTLEGDDEYWMQNTSAKYGGQSELSGVRERDATTVEFFDGVSADQSNNLTQGGRRSVNATDREFFDGTSAMYSNNNAAKSANTLRGAGEHFGTEIEHMERKSADFGDVSQGKYDRSQADFCPRADQDGRSDESSEGVVANHDPFNGVQEAGDTQGRRPPQSSDQDASPDEDNRPSGRTRRIKQVLYSDKSESSVDDMMEDTPSNYNIANGRLEGKSMGLKAILLYAKNQGIKLGDENAGLAQIQEEGRGGGANDSSGEERTWNNMSMPMGTGVTHQVGVSHTLDQDRGPNSIEDRQKRNPTKRNPGVQKQFLEPSDKGGMTPLKKNNFI